MFLFITQSNVYAQAVVFAPLPMENKETVIKEFAPLVAFLSTVLGSEVVIDYSECYADILDKFRRNQIDIAYLGPLPYVSLKAAAPQAVPLVGFKEKSGNTTYTCCLVAMADAVPDLNKMTGKNVALTQPLSTCGFLSVNGLLAKHGSTLSNNFYRYLKKHDEAALSVVRGEYILGGLKTAIAHKYAHLGLVVVDETEPMPSFALIANANRLSPQAMERIRDALVRLDPSGKNKVTLQRWGENTRYGAVPIKDADYDSVRKLLKNTVIPQKGNF